MKKRLLAFGVTLVMIAQLLSGVIIVSAADVNQSKELMVLGNQVVLKSNAEVVVRLTGLNIPGGEWTGTPSKEYLQRSAKEAMENWHSNLLRIPVDMEGWFGFYDYTNDGGKSYRDYIDSVIKMASDAGKYAILDFHHFKGFSSQLHKTFWEDAAEKYRNNPTVLFGIFNEAHGTGWEVWRNGGYVSSVKYIGHQEIVETIRDKGARNIIIAGGLDYAFDLSGIGGDTPTTSYDLVDQGKNGDTTKTGNGIMYDTHIYPWKDTTSNWHAKVGNARKKYPILVGENGYDANDTVQKQHPRKYDHRLWVPELFAWMNDEKTYGNLAHWTGWSFHPNASPRIITADALNSWGSDSYVYTPTNYWGTYVKAQLKKDLGVNLLEGKTVTSLPAASSTNVPSRAIDGNDTTAWEASSSADKWIKVDLGGQKMINRWNVRHASSGTPFIFDQNVRKYNTNTFRLQVSENGLTNWTNVDIVSNNIAGVTDRYFKPVLARYVRLYISKSVLDGTVASGQPTPAKIFEFNVYKAASTGDEVKEVYASKPSGYVPLDAEIVLSTETEGASIRYTTDGQIPNIDSKLYEEPIVISKDTTIRAIAVKSGMVDSEISTYMYTVPSLLDISIEEAKTVYYSGEAFDFTQGKVVASYTQSVIEDIPFTSNKLSFSGFDPDLLNVMQTVTVTYKDKKATYTTIVKETLNGDYELAVDMSEGQQPNLWGNGNGTAAGYYEYAGEDGESTALMITGGENGGWCQLALDSEDFGAGIVTHHDGLTTDGFIGASYLMLRIKSTDDFNMRFKLDYAGDESKEKNSKPFLIRSTNDEWMDVIIPFSELADPDDPSWINDMKGNSDKDPVILLSFEDINFGESNYAIIEGMRVLWYTTPPKDYDVIFDSTGGDAVESISATPYTMLTALPKATRAGYRFGGWFKDTDLKFPWILGLDQVSGKTVLYAKWLPLSSFELCEFGDIKSTLTAAPENVGGDVSADVYSYSEQDKEVDLWLVGYDVNKSTIVYMQRNNTILVTGYNNVKFDGFDISNPDYSEFTFSIFAWEPGSQDTISIKKAVPIK